MQFFRQTEPNAEKIKNMKQMKKCELISASVLFGGLPEEQLEAVVKIGVVKKFGKGETIFLEGDPGNGFYMVAEGKVKIFKMSFAGKEHILHIFGPGEPFGEVPVFHGKPFPANAEALIKSSLIFSPASNLLPWFMPTHL